MKSGNGGRGVQPLPPVEPMSEETVRRFLALQEQRLVVEVKQAEIALKELEHNQKIADKSIDAQAEDRKDERRTSAKKLQSAFIFGSIGLGMLLLFAGYALWMGKENIIADVLKMGMGFLGGLGASAVYHRRKQPDDEE